ncbi:NUDIX hydrolase [Aquabacter sp. L1I39]|uniref:NUDIX hydrolase n=1 Tax=Aquabacter sp. L1I39 TaxID=2820278 RepID=UPI001ADA5524|nr:NUDIX hydrolase [Aquabacter sp. L1I39]QTL02946.1 NUDIX hydrolase [Aquabacter sp. L1I39]
MSGPPPRPGCAALAVLRRGAHLLLVRRANPPDAGRWGFPGGRMEWGETIAEAAVRELEEETGITAAAGPAFKVLDCLDRDGEGVLRHHYLMVAVLCHPVGADPRAVAADDALEVAWFTLDDLRRIEADLSSGVVETAEEAFRLPP